MHLQIYNKKPNETENFVFKTSSGQFIEPKNNCINLTDNSKQTILMKFSLSSDEPMDNYDVLLRQSHYNLIYPFEKDIINIPFIKPYVLYLFSNLTKEGSEFIFNNDQDEIEYCYFENDEFNENSIDLHKFETDAKKKAKAEKIEKTNKVDIFNITTDKIRSFAIEKDGDKNKAVVMKIKINGDLDFKIFRDRNYVKKSNTLLIIIISVSSLVVIAIIVFIIWKVYKRRKSYYIDFNAASNNNENLIIINNNDNITEISYEDNESKKSSTELRNQEDGGDINNAPPAIS